MHHKEDRNIAVDADLVLAASDKTWWDWMNRMTNCNYSFPNVVEVDYNLSSYFKSDLEKYGIDAMDFWRSPDCYTWVDPVEGSVQAIQELKNLGFNIIVVSHVKGDSNKSKYRFLKRHFGDCVDGYLATKEKHHVRCDYMIDDRNSNLNKFNDDVTCIRLNTCYTQNELKKRDITVLDTWQQIVNYIRNKENKGEYYV